MRLGSHGSAAAPQQGTYAQNAGVQAQHQLGGYVNQIPGVAQAQNLLGKFGSGPNFGIGREGGGGGGGGPGGFPGGPPPPVSALPIVSGRSPQRVMSQKPVAKCVATLLIRPWSS